MDDWQARPPNAGFDIVRVGGLGIVENQLGQLIYREPLHRRRELQYLAGQRFFEKGDPHAASDHPIAPAAHERSQVAIAIALTAEMRRSASSVAARFVQSGSIALLTLSA